MKTNSSLLILLFSFIICFSPFMSAQSSPENIVKQFCTMRFDGSEFTNFKDYQKLTAWGSDYDEPGWDRFFIVDTFSIVKTTKYGYIAYVDVKFHTYGIYNGDDWLPNDTSEIRQYILLNSIDGWKIYNTGENPRICVGAFLNYADKGLNDLYKVSQDSKSDKVVYDENMRMYNERKKSIAALKEIAAQRNKQNH